MLELIDAFGAQGWSIVFATPALVTEHQVDLRERDVDCRSIALNCDSFDAFVADLQPDVVLFDRFMMEEQFGWRVAKACPAALRVLDTEDLHSLRQARHLRLQSLLREYPEGPTRDSALAAYMATPRNSLFHWMSEQELAYREIAAVYRCDLTLVISEFERALLTEQFNVSPGSLHYCPFMLPAQSGELVPRDCRAHFVSIGNFRHAPNWDAVLWLKQRLWPSIRAQLPEAELHLYGAYPPPKATALSNTRERFLVKGWAADAHQVLSQARVCLAPLRFGAGIKGKLADAMRAGTPSVTTPLGAEAMAGDKPWPGVVGTTPDTLVAGAVALYSDPQLWHEAQCNGRSVVAERFDGPTQARYLIERLLHCRENLELNRQGNFTGAMLRHHFHQSTHYMSRWIEAKNRLQRSTGE